VKIILETPRLVLRELSLDDLDFMASMLAHPEVMRFYPKCYSRDEAAAWIRRQMDCYAQHGHGGWLALDKATGEPRGQVGVIPQLIDDVWEAEVGYLIHRPFQRNGLATEAAAACRDYVFDVLDRPRVISLIRPENLPSQGVARNVGLSPGKHTLHAGLDHIIFSLSRADRPYTTTA
jgi:ribosomal-protein-alanine N-acetyltransferase